MLYYCIINTNIYQLNALVLKGREVFLSANRNNERLLQVNAKSNLTLFHFLILRSKTSFGETDIVRRILYAKRKTEKKYIASLLSNLWQGNDNKQTV